MPPTPNDPTPVVEALTLLSSHDLPADMEFLSSLGFQLHTIHPDHDPQVAVMKGHGATLQLRRGATCAAATVHPDDDPNVGHGATLQLRRGATSPAATIHPDDDPNLAVMKGHGATLQLRGGATSPAATVILATDDKDLLAKQQVAAPCGATFRFEALTYEVVYPPTVHKFEVCLGREDTSWVTGRAGMLYRDLLPSRLGGAISASHIRIPVGGPVPDMVHYHTIGFQLIYCLRGWVKLIYEDQGPPFILSAGDCVTQPTEIRHRVLEASNNLEVVEVGVPATHMTTIDHGMTLPTQAVQPGRDFSGQVFCHHKAADAAWVTGQGGLQCRETGVREATGGAASVRILRCEDQISKLATHDADIYWSFVLSGSMQLEQGGVKRSLDAGDAFAAPPNEEWCWKNSSRDLQLLEVALPGNFNATFRNIAE